MSNKLNSFHHLVEIFNKTNFSNEFINQLNTHPNYFVKYESLIARLNNKQLQIVSKKLKDAAKTKDISYGFSQFYDAISELDAYVHLESLGAIEIEFVTDKKSPDIEGDIDGIKYLLEAKRIHEKESSARAYSTGSIVAGSVDQELEKKRIKEKINNIITDSVNKFDNYTNSKNIEFSKKIIFINVDIESSVIYGNTIFGFLDQEINDIKKSTNTVTDIHYTFPLLQ